MESYLLLCPRELCFKLSLLLEKKLVLPAQGDEAVGELLGKLEACGLRLSSHVRILTERKKRC